jgi:hypothetical protein
MRRARALLPVAFLGGAALALTPAACAGLVGADFDSEHLGPPFVGGGDGSVSRIDAAPGLDGALKGDSAPAIPADDGGSCPPGLMNCGGFCVDLAHDPAHCGQCTTACPSDPHGPGVCVSSSCAYACESGWLRCASGCCAVSSPDASTADAGDDAGPPDPGIACGDFSCPVGPSNFCCGGGPDGSGADSCDTIPSDSCGWEFFCDDAAECSAGSVCCYDDSRNVTTSACQSTSCPDGQYQLCTTNAECAGGLACTGLFSANGLQSSYSYCQ